MYKVVAVIPVNGREELFPMTIKRLYLQRGVRMIVVCLCDTVAEFVLAQENGAVSALMPSNISLGNKWQSGIDFIGDTDPDAIMIVGSGNWFTDNWCESYLPFLDEYDMVGSLGMYAVDIRKGNEKKMIRWNGYATGRKGEPVGAGRLISRRILDKMDWQLFDPSLNCHLDRSAKENIITAGGNFLGIDLPDVKCLKVSSYKWAQTNSFVKLWQSPQSDYIIGVDETLIKYGLDEAINLFGE